MSARGSEKRWRVRDRDELKRRCDLAGFTGGQLETEAAWSTGEFSRFINGDLVTALRLHQLLKALNAGLTKRTPHAKLDSIEEIAEFVRHGDLTDSGVAFDANPAVLITEQISPPNIVGDPPNSTGGEKHTPEVHAARSLGSLKYYAPGERGLVLKALEELQVARGGGEVRIIAFTGHHLTSFFCDLLKVEGTTLDIAFGTLRMARAIGSARQLQVMREWWRPYELGDLQRYLPHACNFRWFDCPPSFTGVSLGRDVYMINPYVWTPTINWNPEAAKHRRVPSHTPSFGEFTLSGTDQSALLAIRPEGIDEDRSFEGVRRTFEDLWTNIVTDSGPGRPSDAAFSEMNGLVEYALEELEAETKQLAPPVKSQRSSLQE